MSDPNAPLPARHLLRRQEAQQANQPRTAARRSNIPKEFDFGREARMMVAIRGRLLEAGGFDKARGVVGTCFAIQATEAV